MTKKFLCDFEKEDLESFFSEEDICRFNQKKWDIGDKFRLIWICLLNQNPLSKWDGLDASYGASLVICFDDIVNQTKAKVMKQNIEESLDSILNELDSGTKTLSFVKCLKQKIWNLHPHDHFVDYSDN